MKSHGKNKDLIALESLEEKNKDLENIKCSNRCSSLQLPHWKWVSVLLQVGRVGLSDLQWGITSSHGNAELGQ